MSLQETMNEFEKVISDKDREIEILKRKVADLEREIAVLERGSWAVDKCGDDDWDL